MPAFFAAYPDMAVEMGASDQRQSEDESASVFWRAGITDWKVKCADAPKIDLDAPLMTELQQYLLGKAPLSSRVSVFVAVDETPAPWRAMWSPKKQNDRPLLRYSFYIPGIIMEL